MGWLDSSGASNQTAPKNICDLCIDMLWLAWLVVLALQQYTWIVGSICQAATASHITLIVLCLTLAGDGCPSQSWCQQSQRRAPCRCGAAMRTCHDSKSSRFCLFSVMNLGTLKVRHAKTCQFKCEDSICVNDQNTEMYFWVPSIIYMCVLSCFIDCLSHKHTPHTYNFNTTWAGCFKGTAFLRHIP